MLLSEQTGDETLRYYYDDTGKVTSLTYKKGSNAEVRRFISADNLIASPGTSVQGYNLFAYSDNNPVNKVDYTGRDGEFIHVLNKRLGIEYMQNEDGSPHDKSKGKKGKMPKLLPIPLAG